MENPTGMPVGFSMCRDMLYTHLLYRMPRAIVYVVPNLILRSVFHSLCRRGYFIVWPFIATSMPKGCAQFSDALHTCPHFYFRLRPLAEGRADTLHGKVFVEIFLDSAGTRGWSIVEQRYKYVLYPNDR